MNAAGLELIATHTPTTPASTTMKALVRFAMSEIMKAYDTFGNAAREGALKVVLKNDETKAF